VLFMLTYVLLHTKQLAPRCLVSACHKLWLKLLQFFLFFQTI
jgi:hypothetical protein